MLTLTPNRLLMVVTAALFLGGSATVYAQAHAAPASRPATVTSHPAATPSTERRVASRPAIRSIGGDHLAEWMERHSNLTAPQQMQALAAEPGFKELPATTQARMRDTLAKLQSMPPEKRDQIMARNEAMEKLNPAQREQVRGAMKQLADLPPDQRRYVARTFRGLRELPPQQRQAVLASERFSHLTDAQRASLTSLMQIEPLLPPAYDSSAQTASAQQP